MSNQNNINQSNATISIPNAEMLNNRKEAIQAVYQVNVGMPYPLVSDKALLSNVSTEDLAKSFQVLWSQYNKEATLKSKVATFQMNCRIYDLCCRADILHAAYLQYLDNPPLSVTKRPFHAWIVSSAPKDVTDTIGLAHAGKKSLLRSFPLDQQKRNRILTLVSTFGLGLLACEETIYLGTVGEMTDVDFGKLEANLSVGKNTLSTTFTEASIDAAFESTAAKALYSGANSTTNGNLIPLSNGK